MAVSTSLDAGPWIGTGRLAARLDDAAQDDDETLRGGHRVAGMGVLLLTWGLFLAPPATAFMVITGILR